MYEIILGRNDEDRRKFGTDGTFVIGKNYVRMGQTTSLSNPILMDAARSHVVFVCGKRGSGKSYSLGVVAEGLMSLPEEIKQNIAVLIIDTMGIYWTTEYPNNKDKELLKEWELKPQGIVVDIYAPEGYFKPLRDKGIPIDYPFSVKPSELSVYDWCDAFSVDINSETGVLIARVVERLKKRNFSVQDVTEEIKNDRQTTDNARNAATNLFTVADSWGLFSKEGTSFKDLLKPGRITVLDVSCYTETAGRLGIRALVVALVSKKLFAQRMTTRRKEELEMVKTGTTLTEEGGEKKEYPLVWMMVDEAHEFLMSEGSTIATAPLLTLLREGRQPGISLVLASQQPGKIHTDVMTQSDIVISHLITAKADIDALGALMQSYMREDLNKMLQELPRVTGAALAFDDINERMYVMRIRPRISWHGGESPTPMKEKVGII